MINLGQKPPIGMDLMMFQGWISEHWPHHTALTVTASANAGRHPTILCDCTGGAITILLPAVARSIGMHYFIKKIDSGGNAVTIDGAASETIDGATTQTLASQYDVVHIYCDGTQWWIL